MRILLVLLCVLLTREVRAAAFTHEVFPNLFYIAVTGGGSVIPVQGDYDNVGATDRAGTTVGLDLGYRFGDFAVEAGAHYLKNAWIAPIELADGWHSELVNYEAIQIPVVLKWNYIETPMAVFWVKGGAAIDTAPYTSDEDLVPKQFVTAILGIGGTSELSDKVGFVLDISAHQQIGFSTLPKANVIVSAGFIFGI